MRMVLSPTWKGPVAAPPKKILSGLSLKKRHGETMTGGYSIPVSFSIWLMHSVNRCFLFSISSFVTLGSSLQLFSMWILTFRHPFPAMFRKYV